MYNHTPFVITIPGNVPFPVHQQMNFLNTAVVGIVQPFGQMLLQIRLEVLVCPSTLNWDNGSFR